MEILALILANLLPIAGSILIGLVPVFVAVIAHYIKKWTGVQISAAQRKQIEGLSVDAVNFGEEQAHKYFKDTGSKLGSADKMRAALDFLTRQAVEMDLPGLAIDAARDLVEARLGRGRNNETK